MKIAACMASLNKERNYWLYNTAGRGKTGTRQEEATHDHKEIGRKEQKCCLFAYWVEQRVHCLPKKLSRLTTSVWVK